MHIGIVGAGVIGLATAYQLVRQGHQVTVYDAADAGHAASAANAGWVTPFLAIPRAAPGVIRGALDGLKPTPGPLKYHFRAEPGFAAWGLRFLRSSSAKRSHKTTAALQKLAGHALEHFDALESDGVEFEHHRRGLGIVFQKAENLEAYYKVIETNRQLGYTGATTTYRGPEAQEFDPAISTKMAGVIHVEEERHIRPESLCAGLAQAFTAAGGQLLEHQPIKRIERSYGNRWALISDSGREIVDQVVLAAGFHTRDVLKPLGIRLPLEAAKGVSLTARGTGTLSTHPLKLAEHMVASSPYEGGMLRLSGTFDVGDRDPSVDNARLEMVVRDGLSYFEDFRPTEVVTELAGHRPTTSDDAPLLGYVDQGLYVATGHGTLGVTLGPTTGALVAQEITTGIPHPDLVAFRPQRFSLKL